MTSCSLEISARVVLRAEGGPPDAEYALFVANEIELRAVAPGSNVEAGYRTTAEEALARLDALGVTARVMDEAARAMAAIPPRAYTRGDWGDAVYALLGPAELFDGYRYDATSATYEGRWLDLAALARDLGTPRAGAVLQAIGLRALIAEAPRDAEVVLDTHALMKAGRPGARSYKRPDLSGAAQIVEALRALSLSQGQHEPRAPRSAADLVQSIQERGLTEDRRKRLEGALSSAAAPDHGPLSDPRAWAIEAAMSRGELDGIGARIDALEAVMGRQPITIYLRARASLFRREEAPHVIGERLEQLVSSHPFPELELLAAQAFLAADEPRRARAYARAVCNNPTATAAQRRAAESVGEGLPESILPPAAPSRAPTPMTPPATPMDAAQFDWEDAVHGLPLIAPAAPIPDLAVPELTLDPTPRPSAAPSRSAAPHPMSARPQWAKGASQPPFRTEPPPPVAVVRPLVAPTERRAPEPVEMLSLPPGLHGEVTRGERPKTAVDARIYLTHLARELGRYYRTHHNVELWTDLRGIELAQSGLRESFPGGTVTTPDEMHMLEMHGAFLSEVLARMLGAEWTDLGPTEMGYWAMTVPPSTRVWPFGRVHRWVVMGHKERDLVSYYLELEARAHAH